MILHIFRKDVRRLWWLVALSLVLLAVLAHEDRWRGDLIAGPDEGWLNLLLPVLWACLLALDVGQEPLAGDRQFWITRPYRRLSLAGAKALFAVLFVHLPWLLAGMYILWARGFSPWAGLPHLLWKQVLLAAAVTLPAVALATLFRNFTHFMLALFGVATLCVIVSGRLQMYPSLLEPATEMRRLVTMVVLAVAGLAVAALQYARRRVVLARGLGLVAALAAAAIAAWLPDLYAMDLQTAVMPAPIEPSLRLGAAPPAAEDDRPSRRWTQPGRVTCVIPMVLSGLSEGTPLHIMRPLGLELIGAGGERVRAALPSDYRANRPILLESFLLQDGPRDATRWSLVLRFTGSVFERFRSGKAGVSGAAGIETYRNGTTVTVPFGANLPVPGAGRCYSMLQDDRSYVGRLKVVCESPGSRPPQASVRLVQAATGRDWTRRLGPYGVSTSYPAETWLSPLARLQGSFEITELPETAGEQRYLVPHAALDGARLEITPEVATGYRVLHYELSGLMLSDYALPLR